MRKTFMGLCLLAGATSAQVEPTSTQPIDAPLQQDRLDPALDSDPAPDRKGLDRLLERFDKNGNGKLDAAERKRIELLRKLRENPGLRDRLTQRIDIDGDGQLDQDERAGLRELWRERRSEDHGTEGRRDAIRERFDRNDDGRLGPRERDHLEDRRQGHRKDQLRDRLLERSRERFDRNDDGQLGPRERDLRRSAWDHLRRSLNDAPGTTRGGQAQGRSGRSGGTLGEGRFRQVRPPQKDGPFDGRERIRSRSGAPESGSFRRPGDAGLGRGGQHGACEGRGAGRAPRPQRSSSGSRGGSV